MISGTYLKLYSMFLKIENMEVKKKQAIPFNEPVAWLPQKIHRETNCYFFKGGYNFEKRNSVKHAIVDCFVKAVPIT